MTVREIVQWYIVFALSFLCLTLLAVRSQAADLPDSKLTPGVAVPALTKEKLCAKGFTTKSIRNVPQAVKNQAYAEYGLTRNKPPCPCEIDHLVSLEVGGANDLKNLWPQSYQGQWNAMMGWIVAGVLLVIIIAVVLYVRDHLSGKWR